MEKHFFTTYMHNFVSNNLVSVYLKMLEYADTVYFCLLKNAVSPILNEEDCLHCIILAISLNTTYYTIHIRNAMKVTTFKTFSCVIL